jgi:hypothetical protein
MRKLVGLNNALTGEDESEKSRCRVKKISFFFFSLPFGRM